MARLDSVSVGGAPTAARTELANRLTSAASAFDSLYLAGFEHGSAASNRVTELVDEINADSKARAAAASEMGALLNDEPRG